MIGIPNNLVVLVERISKTGSSPKGSEKRHVAAMKQGAARLTFSRIGDRSRGVAAVVDVRSIHACVRQGRRKPRGAIPVPNKSVETRDIGRRAAENNLAVIIDASRVHVRVTGRS